MIEVSRVTRRRVTETLSAIVFAALVLAPVLPAQQRPTGTLTGVVVNDDGTPVSGATIRIALTDGSAPRDATSDAHGAFRAAGLPPGIYTITARRIGFQPAERPLLRIVAGQNADLRITLTVTTTHLSTVTVTSSATSIDVTTTELSTRIDVADVKLVPMGRDAASLVDLVPGARKGFVWGSGGDAANNYQLDGVAVNHPGTGGDFLTPSIDWIEALEVKGLGAGAESGNFQGGIINAITKSGTNKFQAAGRVNYISPALTANNIRPLEEGSEPISRREFSGEVRGPLVKDRLFYFLAGQFTNRTFDIPNLLTTEPGTFRSVQPTTHNERGMAKLTFLPGSHDRLDAIFGYSGDGGAHTGLNGIDDPNSTQVTETVTKFYTFDWTHTNPGSSLDVRLAGFDGTETHLGYAGDNVPGVQVFSAGREPKYQNSIFNERLVPRSLSGSVTWKNQQELLGGQNQIVIGGEYTRGWWTNQRTRNGGVTWGPYFNPATGAVDGNDASTWVDEASTWGGEIHLNSTMEDAALLVQDYFNPISSLTITPGLRYGRWTGWLTPQDPTKPRFQAVQASAIDPRIGVVWDVTGTKSFVIKAHWGRFHQGMSSFFFDRAQGADVFSDEATYRQGPKPLSSSKATYTVAQRDAPNSPFGSDFPTILNEAGAVVNYKQPYVDQAVFGIEKTFGPRWKLELTYTNRVNRDIAGLVDQNLANDWSPIKNLTPFGFISYSPILDQNGAKVLVIPVIYVRNDNLIAVLQNQMKPGGSGYAGPPGYTVADLAHLSYHPNIQLTTFGTAKRHLDQVSLTLRTEQENWNGLVSVTSSQLRGNVAGLTGFSTSDTSFNAGPGVRPNDVINTDGLLPNYPAFEAKLWVSGKLWFGFQGGAFTTYNLGEYFAPTMQITSRFNFQPANSTGGGGLPLDPTLFEASNGQTILLEQQGARKYPSRENLDLRLERSFGQWTLTADLFNALASAAIIQRNLTINDQVLRDPTSLFGAPRLRVPPRALQVGVRFIF